MIFKTAILQARSENANIRLPKEKSNHRIQRLL